jgi:integrase
MLQTVANSAHRSAMNRDDKNKRGRVVIARGNTSVRIYKCRNRKRDGRVYAHFAVIYFEFGKRVQKNFASRDEAHDEAAKIATRIENGERDVLRLSNTDASSYAHAMEKLRPLGVPLHVAIDEYVQVVALLKGRPLLDAARELEEKGRAAVTARLVADVVDEFIESIKRRGKSVRYVRSIRSHLTRFKQRKEFHGTIGDVTTGMLETWLDSLGVGPRTRNNLRCSLVTLFHFARKQRYLSRGIETEADLVDRHNAPAASAKTYAPEELKKLLAAADERVVPFLVIGAFTGIRSSGIERMRWENIKWDQDCVEVPASAAKKGKRYTVPLLPCLASWLLPYRKRKGPIVKGVRLYDRIGEAFAKAKVTRLHNGLRDSFISYRVADTKKLPEVAYEAGNSVDMIRSKYLEARTKKEAEQWFGILRPTPHGKIIDMTGKAA